MRIGHTLDGASVDFDPMRRHTLVSGMTGSGKSSTSYLLLGHAAGLANLTVMGVDPEGVLLRPLRGHPGIAAGHTEALDSGLDVLESAVALITERIASLPMHSDGLTPADATTSTPAVLVVLEELQLLGELYKAAGKPQLARFQSAMTAILIQGRKALVHCLAITQKPLSDVVPGRSQFGRLIIHRMQQKKDIALVWDGIDPAISERLAVANPGQAAIIDGGEPVFGVLDYCPYPRYVRRMTSMKVSR